MFKFSKSSGTSQVAITVSTPTFVRLALLTIGTFILLISIHKAAHALLLVFSAFFLALALNAPVHWVGKHIPGKRKGSRVLAAALSYLLIILFLGGFIASIASPLARQSESFINAAPRLVRDFRSQDSQVGHLIRQYHLEKQVDSFSSQLSERIKNIGGPVFSTLQKVGDSAFSLLTILVLTFMMLVEAPNWLALFREIVPDKHQPMLDGLMHDMYRVVKGYVNGQVILAALAALLIMPAVLALHISYPVALMVVIFVCGLIPLVGHTIGAVIVTTVALFDSTTAALIILIYYITYQQVENIFVQPRIQANSTDMSPLLVFMSVVIGVSFGGLIGGLVAIPAAGCLRIVILEYLQRKKIITAEEFTEATSEHGSLTKA